MPSSLSRKRIEEGLGTLKGWSLSSDGKSISREFLMKDFSAAAALIGDIAPIADADDHHPDLHLTGYRKLRVELTTHSIGDLSEKDFTLAAKIEKLQKRLKI